MTKDRLDRSTSLSYHHRMDAITVLWAARFDYQKNWTLASHRHEHHHQIISFFEGSAVIGVGGELMHCESPTLLFFPPQTEHAIVNVDSERLCSYDIKFTIDDPHLAQEILLLRAVHHEGIQIVNGLLSTILRQGLLKPPHYRRMCALQLEMVLLWLLQVQSGMNEDKDIKIPLGFETAYSSLTSQVLTYLEELDGQTVDSHSLENAFSLSYRHLSNRFKADVGLTPLGYAAKLRIERAKALLVEGAMEIKEVSEYLGYGDVHHFTKNFHQAVGMPPASWRRLEQGHGTREVALDPEFTNQYHISKH